MDLVGHDFLTLLDFTPAEIGGLLDLAAELKAKKKAGIPHDTLRGKNVALIFEKTSTRTRCSFEVAAHDFRRSLSVPRNREEPRGRIQIYLEDQSGGRHLQRNGSTRSGRHRSAGRQTRHGRKRTAFQNIRRHRRFRHRGGYARRGRIHPDGQEHLSHLRRHQDHGITPNHSKRSAFALRF